VKAILGSFSHRNRNGSFAAFLKKSVMPFNLGEKSGLVPFPSSLDPPDIMKLEML
jgi:hypothetical protein